MQVLTVVNRMLASMGEVPLNSLTDSHAYLGAAQDTLARVNSEQQAEGAWFNVETITLNPSSVDKSIYLPGDILEIRTGSNQYVQRGTRLYNLTGGTYVFNSPITLEVVRLVDFEALPEVAAAFYSALAVAEFQTNYDGDTAKARDLNNAVERARIAYNRTNTRNERANLLNNNPRLARIKRRYMGTRFNKGVNVV